MVAGAAPGFQIRWREPRKVSWSVRFRRQSSSYPCGSVWVNELAGQASCTQAVAVQCNLRSASIMPSQPEPTMSRFAIAFILAAVIHLGNVIAEEDTQQAMPTEFKVRPIGHVQKMGERIVIILDKKYQEGLLGLEHWSHVQVIWWFDKNDTPEKRAILQVHPRGDQKNPLTGVFATRSPFRPNLIALSLCKIVSVKDNVIEVEKIDAFEGTPVLDIKPYAPGQDSATEVRVPDWAKPK